MAKLFWIKLHRLQRQPITPVDFCIVMRAALANLPSVPKHLGGGEPQSDEEARDVILVRLEQLKDSWQRVIAQCDNVNRIFSPEELDGIIESAEEKQTSIRSMLSNASTLKLLPAEFIATMRNTLCQDADSVFEHLATLKAQAIQRNQKETGGSSSWADEVEFSHPMLEEGIEHAGIIMRDALQITVDDTDETAEQALSALGSSLESMSRFFQVESDPGTLKLIDRKISDITRVRDKLRSVRGLAVTEQRTRQIASALKKRYEQREDVGASPVLDRVPGEGKRTLLRFRGLDQEQEVRQLR